MGRSLSTKLVYGYDLGGESDDDGWRFNNKPVVYSAGTPYEYTVQTTEWPAWVHLDGDEENPGDFIDQANDRLVREIAKFTEEYTADSGYFERRNAAKKLSGLDILDFELYGVSEYTAWAFGVDLGGDYAIHPVDVTKLLPVELAKYDKILRRALEALEIKPTGQPVPRLMSLASYF
jgi:hypothetical protein